MESSKQGLATNIIGPLASLVLYLSMHQHVNIFHENTFHAVRWTYNEMKGITIIEEEGKKKKERKKRDLLPSLFHTRK